MSETAKLIQYAKEHHQEFLDILEDLVNKESHVYADKSVKDICGESVEKLFASLGFNTWHVEHPTAGTHICGTLGEGEKNIFLIGHYDTVFPVGTTAARPFTTDGERAYGPGVFDMKGGLVLWYMAVKALQELDLMPKGVKLSCFINADEEGGSVTSRDSIIEMAKSADVCLSAEPGQSEFGVGFVCDRRFGRAVYTVKAVGVMGHTGHDPKFNPALEIARQAKHISENCRTEDGKLFASIVSMHAGEESATAMTPGEAYVIVDIRFADNDHKDIALNVMNNLRPTIDGVSLELSGGVEKPPLIQTGQTRFVVDRAKEIIEELGHEFAPAISGGGSDTNFTGGAGCPTLDGLGLNGCFLHNPEEFITLSTIPERVALAAELIRTVL